jgi:CRP-like cAMP-binding protein
VEQAAYGNALLRSLEGDALEQITPKPRLVEIERGDVLIGHSQDIESVYFPVSGLVGILAETPDGEAVDSALVGLEGAVGIFEACGSRHFIGEAVVHVPGRAVRMAAQAYRQLFDRSPALRTAVHRYVEQCINETRQSLLCTTMHDMDARLGRLILEAIEKARVGDTLPLTQGTMARILGAQRSTVSEALAKLERDGVLTRGRAALRIDDVAALEATACSCRTAIRISNDAIWSSDEPSCEALLAAE